MPTVLAILNGGVTEVPRILATNLPLAGNYYLSYLLIQCLHFVASTLFRPQALVQWYRASRGGWTPRERRELLQNLFYWVRWGEIYPFYNVLATAVLTYSLLTPFILLIGAAIFGITYVCFHYLLRDVSWVEVDTRGQLYFRAWFGLFWGIYTLQATIIGLFILKFDARNTNQRTHDLRQLTVLLLTLFFTVQHHLTLSRLYGPLMRHQEGTSPEPIEADTALDQQDRQHFEASDVYSATSTDGSAYTEQCLHGRAPVIWLPRDPAGISQALIERIRSELLASSPGMAQVTDLPTLATIDNRPQLFTARSKA
ncbi:hypothetical protein LTR70_008781 [Exophiala xenobiotica]|uniref:CSC1/OSCA1-like 7TM region domain-containing protein n=1 Tax=Lithohypha guttulata TaxID=1690604 RepID=A0ABR0JVV5_9EURO|nr:hypothetical protein LTR24_009817 [Lithohypha guttulata]KAK5311451.1 hypothetical protein LTR70_008781 [Exophiala xenobiotica]